MSDFSMKLNEDQLTLQKWVHGFAEDVMRPAAEEWDEREEFPWPIVEEAAQIGLYGWEFMAELMMNDPTGLSMVVAIEEMFWGDAGIGMALMGSGLAAAGIAASGTGEQVMEWVRCCDGSKINTGAFAASEPDAGPRQRLPALRQVRRGQDEWVLNGTKAWITNGGMADIHVVVAVVDPELVEGLSFIVLPDRWSTQGQKYKKHGIRASHTAEVVLEDVRVPGRCLLGGKEKLDERLARVRRGEKGNAQAAMQTFEATRPAVGAQAIGIARAAYEYSLQYAKERHVLGRPIIKNQGILHAR